MSISLHGLDPARKRPSDIFQLLPPVNPNDPILVENTPVYADADKDSFLIDKYSKDLLQASFSSADNSQIDAAHGQLYSTYAQQQAAYSSGKSVIIKTDSDTDEKPNESSIRANALLEGQKALFEANLLMELTTSLRSSGNAQRYALRPVKGSNQTFGNTQMSGGMSVLQIIEAHRACYSNGEAILSQRLATLQEKVKGRRQCAYQLKALKQLPWPMTCLNSTTYALNCSWNGKGKEQVLLRFSDKELLTDSESESLTLTVSLQRKSSAHPTLCTVSLWELLELLNGSSKVTFMKVDGENSDKIRQIEALCRSVQHECLAKEIFDRLTTSDSATTINRFEPFLSTSLLEPAGASEELLYKQFVPNLISDRKVSWHVNHSLVLTLNLQAALDVPRETSRSNDPTLKRILRTSLLHVYSLLLKEKKRASLQAGFFKTFRSLYHAVHVKSALDRASHLLTTYNIFPKPAWHDSRSSVSGVEKYELFEYSLNLSPTDAVVAVAASDSTFASVNCAAMNVSVHVMSSPHLIDALVALSLQARIRCLLYLFLLSLFSTVLTVYFVHFNSSLVRRIWNPVLESINVTIASTALPGVFHVTHSNQYSSIPLGVLQCYIGRNVKQTTAAVVEANFAKTIEKEHFLRHLVKNQYEEWPSVELVHGNRVTTTAHEISCIIPLSSWMQE